MALVQKLTGLSHSEDEAGNNARRTEGKAVGYDDTTDVQVNSSPAPNPYLSDVPLFTPNSSDFFCSSSPFYRYPDHMFSSPNISSSIFFEVLKGYPDYCN
ncbi:hypothetical protein IFM89_037832 [Coptis chinensis]|uniref:Uncharacterized protein n=1 Tax=Coptis chinensis TaxID=261450 RepID=A0A835LY47_9MAGN|nr:hypothetical protein IFM89_037832 [Coptis chinensis]